jgi:hypothetical protein
VVETHGYMSEGWNEFQGKASREIVAAVTPFKDVTDTSTSVGGSAGNGVSTSATSRNGSRRTSATCSSPRRRGPNA